VHFVKYAMGVRIELYFYSVYSMHECELSIPRTPDASLRHALMVVPGPNDFT
jgi:hypothetical protein